MRNWKTVFLTLLENLLDIVEQSFNVASTNYCIAISCINMHIAAIVRRLSAVSFLLALSRVMKDTVRVAVILALMLVSNLVLLSMMKAALLESCSRISIAKVETVLVRQQVTVL